MRVLRRVADKMRMRGNTASDVQVLQMLGAPSLEVALQKNRLSYLASLLRSPAVHLRAFIAMRTPEGNKQPWAMLVQQGLEEMFKMFPFKLAELGHPAETPDAWHDFICNHPEAWKSLVRMWARQATVQGLGQDSRPCKRRRTAGPAKEGGDKAHPHVCGFCNVGFPHGEASNSMTEKCMEPDAVPNGTLIAMVAVPCVLKSSHPGYAWLPI